MVIRKTGMAALALTVAVVAGAQAIHAGGGLQRPQATTTSTSTTPPVPSFSGLQTALSLTDSQVTQLQTLVQSQAGSLQTLRTNLFTAQQALQTAIKGGETSAIGTATLAVQTAQAALTAAQKANLQALLNVLTTSQQQIISDYLLIAQNGGPGPFGPGGPFGGLGGPGGRGGQGGGPGGPPPQFRGGPTP